MEENRDPHQIYQCYLATAAEIAANRRQNNHAFSYSSLEDLNTALETGLTALPETAELIDLQTANLDHFEDVGLHTLRVVAEVKQTAGFGSLPPAASSLLVIATYLHDIGKGPRQRWAANGGLQQVDAAHPEKALPMLSRIFSQEIEKLELHQIDLILRLVTYHDLPGLILLGRRSLNEAFRVLRTPLEADLLIMLSQADARSINPAWERAEERENLRLTLRTQLF